MFRVAFIIGPPKEAVEVQDSCCEFLIFGIS
jgi:hypothetical protein